MSFTVVIPARYASQRLPGKPLADIAGKTMIERVYRSAEKSDAKNVYVATDDERVFKTVKDFGGNCLMTSADHPSGTDRLQEVASLLSLDSDDIVVNVQGDEPLIPAVVINQVAENLQQFSQAQAATLSEAIVDIEKVFNPNAVKVVTDEQGYALYFSRASIPWVRDNYDSDSPSLPSASLAQLHIGIYAYRVSLLNQFVTWPSSALEQNERLEQLRILSNGCKIHVAKACQPVPGGVDTPEDLVKVQKIFSKRG
ncbi:3-deoxy-manno-octulosonate cytidylyltransferase [Agarilytica rhodophyticola]|uniref:3-deoxy-manno-octulosonate cytidylyltransferase n=1 Tax=Agarilytica rhodophyticola TaxID=1737490 RepID=UPI000B346B57|nr:3-deoxy-manno-octulosonate cytidylyltransferase [Agarilytica rhodophyticola]